MRAKTRDYRTPPVEPKQGMKVFIVGGISVTLVLILAVLVVFQPQFVGKAVSYGTVGINSGGFPSFSGQLDPAIETVAIPLKINVDSEKIFASAFELTYPSSLLSLACPSGLSFTSFDSVFKMDNIDSNDDLGIINVDCNTPGIVKVEYNGFCDAPQVDSNGLVTNDCPNALSGEITLAELTFTINDRSQALNFGLNELKVMKTDGTEFSLNSITSTMLLSFASSSVPPSTDDLNADGCSSENPTACTTQESCTYVNRVWNLGQCLLMMYSLPFSSACDNHDACADHLCTYSENADGTRTPGTCAQCSESGHCTDADYPVCSAGRCIAETPECAFDADCATGEVCNVEGNCETAPDETGDDTSGDEPSGCTSDEECDDGLGCNGLETCEIVSGECIFELPCQAPTPVCVVGSEENAYTCVECVTNAHCSSGEVCENNQCVPEVLPLPAEEFNTQLEIYTAELDQSLTASATEEVDQARERIRFTGRIGRLLRDLFPE